MRTLALSSALALLVGCMAADKGDIAQSPFAGDYADGKADSARFPRAMGSLLVGESVLGEFSYYHGWDGWEIQLAASPQVDIFLGDSSGASNALDTILYVYGPKKANGYYPSRAIAFNDDIAPGETLSSYLALRVPTTGTYRVVVSTYDNWDRYPRNVSRGQYKLTVKCPTGGDSCGPAIRFEGDACTADAQCVEGTHCEGEIVCAPFTECLYFREGACTEDYAWLTYAPVQCGQNPWELDPAAGDGDTVGYRNPELQAIDDYFESSGIDLLALGLLSTETDVVCLSCACSRGDLLVVQARLADADALADRGFTRIWPDASWMTREPTQCGTNPWVEDGGDEAAAVREWADGEGAELGKAGFVQYTDPRVICRACSCPRGDLLVVTPRYASGAAAVANLGFAPLYK